MKNKNRKILIVLAVVFVLGGILFMFKDSIFSGNNSSFTGMPEANGVTNEITANISVTQDFKCETDVIENIALVFYKNYEFEEDDGVIPSITVELLDNGNILLSETISVKNIENQHRTFVKPSSSISGMSGKILTLRIFNNSNANTRCSLMMQDNKVTSFNFGNMKINGTICFEINSKK